jgi:hypothetical protein
MLERRTLLSLTPAGGEFPVNTYTFEFQDIPAVAMDADGDFVVAWQSLGQEAGTYDPPDLGVYAQRYNALGVPQGEELHVNTTTTNRQGSPAVAMDDSGDFVVAWNGNGPGDPYGIHAQRFNAAGVRQGTEFTVASTNSVPSVAMDADGDFVVAYTAGGYGFGYRVHARRYNAAGVPQGSVLQVNATTSTRKERPDVAMDDAGNFVVTWESMHQDGNGYGVYARRYDAAGVAQGGEFRVNTFTTGAQWFPAVAMDDDGDFVVTWSDFAQPGIYAQRYDEMGVAQGAEFRVNAGTAHAQTSDIAVAGEGSFTVTWQSDEEGLGWGILARTFSAGGVPQQHQFRVNTTAASDQTEPAAAMSADGKAVIAWQGIAGPFADIFARRFVEGVPPPSHVGPEFRVNTYTPDGQGFPSAAMDADGDFVIVWESAYQDSNGYGIYAQRYNAAGVAQGAEFRVNTTISNHQYDPEVAMDADGDFVVVWSDYLNNDVYARRFNAMGVAQGPEFLVNTFTFDSQIRGAVAMDADGDFVIAWESYQEGFGGWGVYAQRYSAVGVPQGNEFHVNTFTPALQFDSSVAMDAAGNFVIVWQNATNPDTRRDVFGQRYNAAGVAQGEEFQINVDTNGSYFDPSVVMDLDGDFAVAFTGRLGPLGSQQDVFARRYDESGIPQGDEFRVNTFTSDHQRRAAIAMTPSGAFVVAWESLSQDTANFYSMYAQAYDAGGQPVGGELRVSASPITPPPNNLAEHTMAMDADGDFVVAWANYGRDGSSYGVYAQRFAGSFTPVAPAPTVNSSSFLFATAPHRLRFTFDQDVSASLGTNDIVVVNLTTQQTIPSSDLSLSYDAATNTATFSYVPGNGALPDGNYRATLLASGITNPDGTPLAANHVFEFFFLRGDANHDGRVNLQDFNILATNFGQSPRDFTQGDFNYDSVVNLQDFNILAIQFGRILGPAARGQAERDADDRDELPELLDELT